MKTEKSDHDHRNLVPAGASSAAEVLEITIAPNVADRILDEVVEIYRAAGSPGDGQSRRRVAATASAIVRGHAPETHAALERHHSSYGPAIVHVKGLLPSGPPPEIGALRVLALALGAPLGEAFQYRQQNGGEVVPALQPDPSAPAQSGTSAAPFGAHSDDTILPPCFRTRHIALLGVENERGARTGFALVPAIEKRLDPESRDVCGKPFFSTRVPNSYRWTGPAWSSPIPLLYTNRAGERCVQCPTYNTRPLTEAAAHALARFRAAVDDAMKWRVIERGDFVVFRNDRGRHARDAIQGSRLLLRTYWRPDAAALRAATGEAGPAGAPRAHGGLRPPRSRRIRAGINPTFAPRARDPRRGGRPGSRSGCPASCRGGAPRARAARPSATTRPGSPGSHPRERAPDPRRRPRDTELRSSTRPRTTRTRCRACRTGRTRSVASEPPDGSPRDHARTASPPNPSCPPPP